MRKRSMILMLDLKLSENCDLLREESKGGRRVKKNTIELRLKRNSSALMKKQRHVGKRRKDLNGRRENAWRKNLPKSKQNWKDRLRNRENVSVK